MTWLWGHERLIYLMKITDVVKQSEYYENPKFKDKIPDLNKSDFVYQAGDNIYKPIISFPNNYEDFEMIKNRNHWDFEEDSQDDGSLRDDLSDENVLVSNEFYYFGKSAIKVPEEIRPKVPVSQAENG